MKFTFRKTTKTLKDKVEEQQLTISQLIDRIKIIEFKQNHKQKYEVGEKHNGILILDVKAVILGSSFFSNVYYEYQFFDEKTKTTYNLTENILEKVITGEYSSIEKALLHSLIL